MGLAELAGQTDELWKTVVIKGTPAPWMKECTDIARLDKEEHELSQAIYNEVNKWLEQDSANKEKLKDFKQGFRMNYTDGNVYRVIQKKDGGMIISRWKQKSAGSGGFQRGSSYIHMRTDTVLLVHFEELKSLIDNQEDNDNFKVTFLHQMDNDVHTGTPAGPLFLVENVRPYTPKVGSSNESTGKQQEDNNEEQGQES